MLVCPTLRTAAVGVAREGRRDGGRRPCGFESCTSRNRCWRSNERPNLAGVRSSFAMPQRRHTACAALAT
jgi:hypothetical protein